MKKLFSASGSIRTKLLASLMVTSAILAALLFLSVRTFVNQAVEATHDNVLGAATQVILDEIRASDDGVSVDIPYTAFSILGSLGQDRVFYRVMVGETTVTGYEDLPLPTTQSGTLAADFYSAPYRNDAVRFASDTRQFLIQGSMVDVTVILGQTQSAKAAIMTQMTPRAVLLGIGFFTIAAVFGMLATWLVLQAIASLGDAVARRGPQDLRPVTRPMPPELRPFVRSINGFIGRLANALSRTETFIGEAAHRIRTPLTTLRNTLELALSETDDPVLKDRLRASIRAVDDSARSASQMLDQAAVSYRTDQRSYQPVVLNELVTDIADAFRPTTALQDVRIFCVIPKYDVCVLGDPIMIETALRNMLDNAVKYSGAQSDIDIRLSQGEGFGQILVLDRGIGLGGIAGHELIPRFVRGDNASGVVGTGLGLTIVSEVARALKGKFTLTDRDGGGACASLSLPSYSL